MIKINTHIQDARKRLLYQFRGKRRVEGLVSSQAKQIQDLEDAAFGIYTKRPLQSAESAILDRWGRLLNEPRRNLGDADYRARLFFRVRRNITNGTPEELMQILRDLVQARRVQLVEEYPAAIRMSFIGAENPADIDLIQAQMQSLAPAGVKVISVSAGFSGTPFAFLGHPDPQARGFDTFPVQEIGGQLISII